MWKKLCYRVRYLYKLKHNSSDVGIEDAHIHALSVESSIREGAMETLSTLTKNRVVAETARRDISAYSEEELSVARSILEMKGMEIDVSNNVEFEKSSQRLLVCGAPAPQDTPESEFSVEGYQNYTAAEVFIQGLAGMVNQTDVENMIRAQKQMLQRFEKTNEMLLNCNALSQNRLKLANEEFKKHVKLLNEMKKDLDYIFRKIRIIKTKLSQQYPIAFAEAQPQRSSLAEEAEDDGEKTVKPSNIPATINVSGERSNMVSSKNQRITTKPPDTESKATTTVEYVQMEETIENGKPIENELIKRVCSIELTNPNDSSDCTSEDTG